MIAAPLAALRGRLHERFARWALRSRAPETAPVVLTQRRVYVLPTRAGLAYAAALGVILLGAMNYNLNLGYALVFLLAGLGIVAILHTFRNLVGVEIAPGRCEPVFAGHLARFDLVLTNRRGEPRSSLRLFFSAPPAAAPAEIDLPAEDSAVAALALPAPRRGWLTLPRVTVETTWPLGLVRAWSYAAPEQRCLVYPAPAASAPPLPWGGDSARGSSREGIGNDDFAGLRLHQDSDPPRHVAWKAVARQQDGPLLTKLFSGSSAEQVLLAWEALPGALDVEARLAVLARWMLDAEAAGLLWGLALPTLTLPPGHGAAHLAAGLRALALFDARADHGAH